MKKLITCLLLLVACEGPALIVKSDTEYYMGGKHTNVVLKIVEAPPEEPQAATKWAETTLRTRAAHLATCADFHVSVAKIGMEKKDMGKEELVTIAVINGWLVCP